MSITYDTSKVIPGEVIDRHDDSVESRTPVVRKAGSAAMVAAKVTGRGLAGAGRRWVDGYTDGHRQMIETAKAELAAAKGDPGAEADARRMLTQRRAEYREHRKRYLAKTGIGVGGLGIGATVGTLVIGGWAEAAMAIAGITAGAIHGRKGGDALEPGPEVPLGSFDLEEDDGEPFPLAWCKDGDQVRVCVERAFAAESIGTRSVTVLGYRGWGWEIDVLLKGSTPAKVSAAADKIDSHLDLKQGGTLIETDEQRAAHIILRLVTSNPFSNMSKPAIHAPNSLNISDPHNFGVCMDGSPLDLVLEGLRILAIGVSGAAKSTGVLRDLAEVITACDNAIALDFDPVKDGLREFEGVMAVPPIRGAEECEQWLDYLVRMAKGRNKVRVAMKMGDTWVATRKHPAIFGFFDEFIYMSQKAKELFIELLRIGKQSGIYPVAAGQDATSDSMGDAIAETFTLKIMLASRWDDIRIVLGQGAAAKGYRPDRLVPAQNKDIKNDAGQSYIKGSGVNRPLLYGWNEHSRAAIERAVEERKTAGRPWFDVDTLVAADLLHVITRAGSPATSSLADRLDAFAAQGGVEDALLVAVLMREFELGGETFLPTVTLLSAMHNSGHEEIDSEKLGRLLRKHAPMVKAGRSDEASGRQRGWDRTAIEQAAAGLLNPAGTRSQAG